MVARRGQSFGGNCRVAAFLVCFSGFLEIPAITVQVPGTSNPWLAGMPDDTSSGQRPDFDYAPEHSPVPVVGLTLVPGAALMFEASGSVNKGPGWNFAGPDGDLREIAGKVVGGEHGIADLVAPKNSLTGVFLGPDDPDFSPTPLGLNFSSVLGRDFNELRPKLKQPFFIGNGLTSFEERQKFLVPDGATRLFLGTMDGVGWYNNGGSFTVEVRVDQPEISAVDVRLAEGDSGETQAIVVVELSKVSPDAVSVQYATSDSTAIQAADYRPRAGTLTIAAGKTAGIIEVAILGDTEFEPDETFFVNFSSPINGILRLNRVVVTVVNDDAQNLPPVVVLTSPKNSQIFQAGAVVQTVANATDSDGSIADVEFFGDGKTIGRSSNWPYAVEWSGLEPGEHVAFVRATDNVGVSVSSEPVTFVVAKPVPIPPSVTLSTPGNGAVFPTGSSITVAALADDLDGKVARVEFYSDLELIGSRTEIPYQILWQKPLAGDYTLTATATDDAGLIATSNPVVVRVRDLSGDVAIVRPVDDGEVAAIEEHLSELGFSARLFHPEEITFELLRSRKLIIWSDVGRTVRSLSEKSLSALTESFASGIPVYLIGENIASAASHLNAKAELEWSSITHLRPSSKAEGNGSVEFPTTDLSHPVIAGRFGLVDPFDYPAVAGLATISDLAAEVLGRSGNADMLVSYPAQIEEDWGGPRSITQSFPVDSIDDPGSKIEIKELFQNAACWLVRCAVW
ncbi:MAG: Ig-like domain-containing protein [Verrucomicrobia bacterium]|nr:Ig-like domain-containing protein [Verrucomicrobiota bacterium]